MRKGYGRRMMHHLAGVAEVAGMLGVSRQRVSQLAGSRDFPEPVVTLAAGPVWERKAVEDWAERTGRTLLTD